ncbi:unnamed protein product [Paramecium sonneborni]|uniref:Uncharacterized protein n=1 Tax=Paramecium sonneborni TaxID=65129 RepID=A0A8S1LWV4_9CILI|nr:unnamed protein product [Paramecium sonneborni]
MNQNYNYFISSIFGFQLQQKQEIKYIITRFFICNQKIMLIFIVRNVTSNLKMLFMKRIVYFNKFFQIKVVSQRKRILYITDSRRPQFCSYEIFIQIDKTIQKQIVNILQDYLINEFAHIIYIDIPFETRFNHSTKKLVLNKVKKQQTIFIFY